MCAVHHILHHGIPSGRPAARCPGSSPRTPNEDGADQGVQEEGSGGRAIHPRGLAESGDMARVRPELGRVADGAARPHRRSMVIGWQGVPEAGGDEWA